MLIGKRVMLHIGKNYQAALGILRPLAEQGFADAQYNFGVSYDRGEGVPQEDKTAVKWLRPAAEGGDSSAKDALKKLKTVV